MAGNTSQPGRSVAGKLALILSSFVRAGEQSLSDVARAADLPLSTAHRLLCELVQYRALTRDDAGRYAAGPIMRTLSAVGGPATAEIEERSARVLADLTAVTGCRVRLGILVGRDVAYMQQLPDSSTVVGFRPGATLPAHSSALGRTLLAYSPPPMASAIIASGRRHAGPCARSAVDELQRSLADVRTRQLAINPGGMQQGNCCFAAPVFGPGGHLVAALGVTVADPELTLKSTLRILSIASRSLSREFADAAGPSRCHSAGS